MRIKMSCKHWIELDNEAAVEYEYCRAKKRKCTCSAEERQCDYLPYYNAIDSKIEAERKIDRINRIIAIVQRDNKGGKVA